MKKNAKPTTKNPVNLTDKVQLPKEKARIIKPKIYTIRPNDIIRFSNEIPAERVFDYATRLAGLAWLQMAKDKANYIDKNKKDK